MTESDCDYCGNLTRWGSQDRPAMKCAHCGAPPRRRASHSREFGLDMEIQRLALDQQLALQRMQASQNQMSHFGAAMANAALWR